MADLVRFVDSISATPGVRLNLSDGTIWSVHQETVIGDPPMKRSVTGTMLRDGEYVGATSYGNRELSLVLNLKPRVSDTAAAELQDLRRELDRDMNILEWRPDGASVSVFFRTFRSSPDSVEWAQYLKTLRVSILAEPFALGLREDLSAITVNNDPAAGSNGLFADLTGIKGDVETPLFIEYTDGAAGFTRSGFAVGVRTGSSPYPNRFYQAESMNQSTDTSVVADAAFSNGNKSRTTFATNTSLTGRLSGGFPNLTTPAGAENWGTYRVFARVAQTTGTDVIKMAIKVGNGTYNPSTTLASKTQPQLVDLGTLDATAGLATYGGYSTSEYRIESQDALVVGIQRVSGAGSLDIDYLAFVPADECYGAWTAFSDVSSTGRLGVVDGPNDAVYIATALSGGTPGRVRGSTSTVSGRLPRVRPGDNRLVVVEYAKGGSAPVSNLLTTSVSMTLRYWPRYVSVRPVGS